MIDIPGGTSKEEFKALRRLARELAADGYRVGKVGLGGGGTPCALVYAGRPRDPIRRIVIGARSVIRAADDLDLAMIGLEANDFEVIQKLRTVASRVARNAEVAPPPETVGEVATVEHAICARRGANEMED
jgi:hypothetical protein